MAWEKWKLFFFSVINKKTLNHKAHILETKRKKMCIYIHKMHSIHLLWFPQTSCCFPSDLEAFIPSLLSCSPPNEGQYVRTQRNIKNSHWFLPSSFPHTVAEQTVHSWIRHDLPEVDQSCFFWLKNRHFWHSLISDLMILILTDTDFFFLYRS